MNLDNIKIIFVDIDGTLSNSNRQITYKTKSSIKRVVSNGIKVVIVSGRNSFYSVNKSKEALATSIVISSDGASIYDYEHDEIIYKNYIDVAKLERVYDYAFSNKIGMLINGPIHSFCNQYLVNKDDYDCVIVSRDNLKDLDVCQIVLMANSKEQLKKTERFITSQGLQISYFSRSFLEGNAKECSIDIVNENVSKGESVKFLLNKLNIKKEDSLCFGDYDNDYDMFMSCGFKVAMGNATLDLKNKADYVTLSNDEDGVAYFLDKFL